MCRALYTSGRDSVTIVIGPLRVTLENFRSMESSLFFCGAECLLSWPVKRCAKPSQYASCATAKINEGDAPDGFQSAARFSGLSRRTRPLHRAKNQAAGGGR